jgi:hypothetical protein
VTFGTATYFLKSLSMRLSLNNHHSCDYRRFAFALVVVRDTQIDRVLPALGVFVSWIIRIAGVGIIVRFIENAVTVEIPAVCELIAIRVECP